MHFWRDVKVVAVSTPALDKSFVAKDFRLRGTDGSYHCLSDFRDGAALIVMFICNHCPYVKAIISRLVDHVRILMQDHDVRAVAIMPNDVEAYPDDSFENMVKFARQYDFPFPYLLDEDQSTARLYGAVCTPDFFGFDNNAMLCYRGRFDDPSAKPSADSSELLDAMSLIARTGEVPERQIPSLGCSIKWRCSG